MTSSLLVGSLNHANHTAKQGSDLEKKMTVTSGRRCLEQFEKFNRPGLWARTFAALLIGTGEWYSMKCRLIWKMKATKLHRFYFQLVPLTHRTGGIESGLLPTPTSVQREHPERVQALKATGAETMMSRNNGENRPNSILDHMNFYGMLPTPREAASRGNASVDRGKGNLEDAIAKIMLPTPSVADGFKTTSNSHQENLNMLAPVGSGSQLNPRFVMEMMGFPPGWTELPFLNGEANPSKPEETQ